MTQAAATPPTPDTPPRLTPSEAALAEGLARRQGLTHAEAYRTLYAAPLPTDRPRRAALASIKVLLSRLRRRLAPHGVEIQSTRGVGWYITPSDQATLRRVLRGCAP